MFTDEIVQGAAVGIVIVMVLSTIRHYWAKLLIEVLGDKRDYEKKVSNAREISTVHCSTGDLILGEVTLAEPRNCSEPLISILAPSGEATVRCKHLLRLSGNASLIGMCSEDARIKAHACAVIILQAGNWPSTKSKYENSVGELKIRVYRDCFDVEATIDCEASVIEHARVCCTQTFLKFLMAIEARDAKRVSPFDEGSTCFSIRKFQLGVE